MKADRAPMSMDSLADPLAEFDVAHNRKMCSFLLAYAVGCLLTGLFVMWMRS
jgi:hypothetical protein